MSIKSKWRRHAARREKAIKADFLYREAVKQTRPYSSVKPERLMQGQGRSSVYVRAGICRYHEPVVYMTQDGVRMIGYETSSITTRKSTVSTGSIHNSSVAKTDQTEYIARQAIRASKISNRIKNPIQFSEKSVNALLTRYNRSKEG